MSIAKSTFANFIIHYLRKEHPRLAARFADTIDVEYELGEHKSDEALRDAMDDALDEFFGNRQDCDIF